MNKAFIFDMDGVVIDSENTWRLLEKEWYDTFLGKDVAEKMGDLIGLTVNAIYDKAVSFGFSMDKETYMKMYDKQAAFIYSKANVTKRIDDLAKILVKHGFKLGLVSSSRQAWINHVLPRIGFADKLKYIISINDRKDLEPKPSPDSYLETIKALGATPQTTIILEDSNMGIQAAKAAGAYVIGFRGNLVEGYKQRGADACADSMDEVIKIVESLPVFAL